MWSALALSLLIGIPQPTTAAPTDLRLRSEIIQKLASTICRNNTVTTRELWQLGLFDTHMEIKTVVPKPGFRVNPKKLAAAAKSMAQPRGHLGIAYGLCPSGKAWAMTTAAPQPIANKSNGEIRIKLDVLRTHCRQISVDYAANQKETIRNLTQLNLTQTDEQEIRFNSKFLSVGTLSVSCLPYATVQGPRPWALVPTHAMALTAPELEQLNSTSDLSAWINRRRLQRGLPPLKDLSDGQSALSTVAQQLLRKNQSTQHHRMLLKQASAELELQDFEFLGENRAKASNIAAIAWLYWNSPRHRKFLYEPQATHMASSTLELGPEKLNIVIMARENSASKLPTTAKSP